MIRNVFTILCLLFTPIGVNSFPFAVMPLGSPAGGFSSADPAIALSGDLFFGYVSTGLSATRFLQISEITGRGSLSVNTITPPAGFTAPWTGVIAAGGQTNIPVTFAPVVATAYSGVMTIASDASSGTNAIAVSGQGVSMRVDSAYRTLHGLSTDGSDDFLDLDGDGFTTLEEWLVGTDPRDAQSHFKVVSPAASDPSGYVVSWPGVEGRTYSLMRSTNLSANAAGGFAVIAPTIPGTAPITSYTDTDPIDTIRYYKVGIIIE